MFREMIRKKQQLSSEACIALLQEQPRGVLSLMGDDGYPYGIPMDYWYCPEDGRLYFHCGREGHKMDAIRRCSKASFCVMDQGFRREGEWALNIQSVIVFGRITMVEEPERAIDITRRLSLKYTGDTAYIDREIQLYSSGLVCFALTPEHMTGKLVNEA